MSNFGVGGGPTGGGTDNQHLTTPKVMTQAQLEAAAKGEGVSVDIARSQAIAQGYQIK